MPVAAAVYMYSLPSVEAVMPDFQRSVSVAVAVSIKTVSVQAVYAVAAGRVRGNSAAGPEAGRRVSRAKEWAELQARRNGRYGK